MNNKEPGYVYIHWRHGTVRTVPWHVNDLDATELGENKIKCSSRTDYIIQNWLRSRSTIEYLGVWEQLHNPNFNPIEFDGFRNQAGLHSFSLRSDLLFQNGTSNQMNGKSEPSLKIGRELSRQLNIDPAVVLGVWKVISGTAFYAEFQTLIDI